ANSAYNLLMGRFVHRRSSTDEWWQYLERGSGDDPFSLSLKDSRGYSRERMEEDLKKVYWIPETELPELSRRLLGGDLCQGTGTYASSLLAANPLAGQVDPYSGSSRRAEPALLVTRVKALQQNQLQRQKPGWTKIYRIRS
ncbi:MAG TPA: hypothetical protein VM802_18130, partial [Chitinophaga sp.]|uniref:hypothetical protein n=1 Tax=Chitinophaga sp. TaxID=1869181 RepID=UPI002CECD2DA